MTAFFDQAKHQEEESKTDLQEVKVIEECIDLKTICDTKPDYYIKGSSAMIDKDIKPIKITSYAPSLFKIIR